MKCIKNVQTDELNRVTDREAELLIDSKEYVYVNKQQWKDAKRPTKSVTGTINTLIQQRGVVA
jgi:hypothetical protein